MVLPGSASVGRFDRLAGESNSCRRIEVDLDWTGQWQLQRRHA
jgi:hypothetical protein